MLMDNMGYGDAGCFGSLQHRTPNLDHMATEGVKLTSFYSSSGVCTPSRASLMTGCYPRRVNMHVGGSDHECVLFPVNAKGLHPDEKSIATLLREVGYATGIIGKWHLGDQPEFLPTRHGFDSFFGCPYSEDMVPNEQRPGWPLLPLMRDEKVVEAPADRTTLTKRYTEEAQRFIRKNKEQPFFLYLAHAMPGSTDRPFASDGFDGKSANGPYGDAIEELDWSAGEIFRTLQEEGLDENTMVIWTSDNGAVGWMPRQGSNAPLKGWGYTTTEGGQRVPFIARWPGRVAAGAIFDDVATMMDIYPTLAGLAGAEMPADRTIDGHDFMPLLAGDPRAESAYDTRGFFFYYRDQLQAVRAGEWKLYLPLEQKLTNLDGDYSKAKPAVAELYNLRNDIAEQREVAAQHPDVVARLMALADAARAELGDHGFETASQRPAGRVDNPTPRLLGEVIT